MQGTGGVLTGQLRSYLRVQLRLPIRCLTSSLSDLDVNLVSALDSLLPSMNDVNVCNPNTLKSTVGIPIANNLEALTLLIREKRIELAIYSSI